MTDKDLKQKILARVHEAVAAEKLSNEKKKLFRQYKCVYGQWVTAREEDIEIMPIKNVDKVTLFSFQADRYYQQQFRDGSLGAVKKNHPMLLNNALISFFGTLYNVNNSEAFTFAKKQLYTMALEKVNCYKERENSYKENSYVVFDRVMDSTYLEKHLSQEVDWYYRSQNETSLFNYPEKTYRIGFSNWKFDEWENLESVPVSIIFLKIKDAKGKILKMYLGNYYENTESFDGNYTGISKYQMIYNDEWERIKPRKSWFKWIL